MEFTLLDGVVLVVVLISALLAMIRGFTREVFSIASWVAAAAAAYFFWDDVRPYVERYVDDENLSLGVSIAGIFFLTLFVVSIITMRISDFVLDSKAGPLDRTLGFLFGVARGLLLVVIAVRFLDFFIPEDQPPWIADARTKPWLTELSQRLVARLPEDFEAKGTEFVNDLTGREPPPAGEDAMEEPVPVPDEPGISIDDQNQLERQLEDTPPE